MKLSELTSHEAVRDARRDSDPQHSTAEASLKLSHQISVEMVRYRARLGLTQTDLAKKLGLQQAAIARLEGGEHTPSLSTLQRLVDAGVLDV